MNTINQAQITKYIQTRAERTKYDEARAEKVETLPITRPYIPASKTRHTEERGRSERERNIERFEGTARAFEKKGQQTNLCEV
eukprot:644709-Pyramimonas_sp.AAC.1